MTRVLLLFAIASALWPAPAEATYSIVAVDSRTREVGGAGASCVGGSTIYQIYGSVPGRGVVHAQARFGGPFRLVEAERLLSMDEAPEAILLRLTDPAFDPSFAQRQYGIVDVLGRAAAFTGDRTLDVRSDRQGSVATFSYSAQGNILTGEDVLTEMQSAFEGGGCDLADRLMRSLEAGGGSGRGDSRCVPRGIPADGAFIQVDRPDEVAGSFLLLRVDDVAPRDPIPELRAAFDAWRVDNPCPAPPAMDAGPPDAGPHDAGTELVDAAPRDAASSDAASAPAPTASCGCRARGERLPNPWLALVALALGLRGVTRGTRASGGRSSSDTRRSSGSARA